MTKTSSRNYAYELLDELGITEPADIDLEAIAEHCGATIVYEKLEGCEARIIGYGDRAIITVSSDSISPRQRFSGGHELGHWVYDKGKNVFNCKEAALTSEWFEFNPEQRANRFSADLLLPEFMFIPRAKDMPITFYTVERLTDDFHTSLTATAIRLVQFGSFPAMLVWHNKNGLKRFVRGPAVSESLWPKKSLESDTMAIEVLNESGKKPGPIDVSASAWFDHPEAHRYVIREDTRRITSDLVLTILWWKDERQLLDLMDEEGEEE